MPKIRCLKNAKFDSSLHGSSTSETAKGSKIYEKSMQNHVKIEHQLESNLGPILERFWQPNWGPSGGQEASKTASKFDWIFKYLGGGPGIQSTRNFDGTWVVWGPYYKQKTDF